LANGNTRNSASSEDEEHIVTFGSNRLEAKHNCCAAFYSRNDKGTVDPGSNPAMVYGFKNILVANAFISPFNTQTMHVKSFYAQHHCYVSPQNRIHTLAGFDPGTSRS
jgi:hypothetical protein